MDTVNAPRLDLCNEDLLKSHFNALYLTTRGIPLLEGSVHDVVDVAEPLLPIKDSTGAELSQAFGAWRPGAFQVGASHG